MSWLGVGALMLAAYAFGHMRGSHRYGLVESLFDKASRRARKLAEQRDRERSRSHYWLSRERDNRRAWMFRALELEEELQVYRKETEERLWN